MPLVLNLVAREASVLVPAIWPLEVTNALVKALRRKHISREDLFEYAQHLAELRVTVETEGVGNAFTEVLALAERYQLTTYDAAYLELAQRRKIPLATVDKNLVQVAGAIGLPVLAV